MKLSILSLLTLGICLQTACQGLAEEFNVSLRSRSQQDDGWVKIENRPESWDPKETAIIVCDMWDAHHCLNAVRRVNQLAPRIDTLLRHARRYGTTIIHAPSSCVDFYQDHPARKNALAVPKSDNLPEKIESWCHWKGDTEQSNGYPIDHSDGGEDDELEEHKRWHKQLAAMGRNPRSPWIRQVASIGIEPTDYITDDGVTNWSILENKGIKNVMMVGVHTNMCVLGRPFGLRQLSRNGKNVVLVRDLTDTMYNPKMPPFVSHFSGTDLIVEHIEQFVCPTISSDQVLGGAPLRFRNDRRPRIAMLIGEQEYDTDVTLPKFARNHLYKDFHVTYSFADANDKHFFHNIDEIKQADLLFVSVRRRTPPKAQLDLIRNHVLAGKPVIGIRTASHAFSLRGEKVAKGHEAWPEFDAQVFGGNYQGHHGNKGQDDARTFVWYASNATHNQITHGVANDKEKRTSSWLYKTSPLGPGTNVLMMGRVGDRMPHEPVAWTNIHIGGGRAFYTSLGHPDEFQNADFQSLLKNSVYWALAISSPHSHHEINQN